MDKSMKDPYIAPDLCYYDKALSKYGISPFTREVMLKSSLVEDFVLKMVNTVKEHNISKDIFKHTVETEEKS